MIPRHAPPRVKRIVARFRRRLRWRSRPRRLGPFVASASSTERGMRPAATDRAWPQRMDARLAQALCGDAERSATRTAADASLYPYVSCRTVVSRAPNRQRFDAHETTCDKARMEGRRLWAGSVADRFAGDCLAERRELFDVARARCPGQDWPRRSAGRRTLAGRAPSRRVRGMAGPTSVSSLLVSPTTIPATGVPSSPTTSSKTRPPARTRVGRAVLGGVVVRGLSGVRDSVAGV